MKHEQKFIWFDFIRGISALMVCAGHLRAVMLVDYTGEIFHSSFSKLFYFLTGLGHQSVMVFFVLSGFFVGGGVLRKRAGFSWSEYSFARLSRLWVVLLPALIFTALIDAVIWRIDPTVSLGSHFPIWNSGPKDAATFSHSFATFLGNLLFLQTIQVSVFGTNGPLWSLANEFWYYVLFPILAQFIFLPWTLPYLKLRTGLALLGLAVNLYLPWTILSGFLIWILGVLVWWAGAITFKKYSSTGIALGWLLFLGSIVYSKSSSLQTSVGIPPDLCVGLGFAILAIMLARGQTCSGENAFTRFSRFISGFSFSLYVIHFPIVLLIGVTFYGTGKVQPDPWGLIQFISWFCLLILIGITFWWGFEKQTGRLRRYLSVFTKTNKKEYSRL